MKKLQLSLLFSLISLSLFSQMRVIDPQLQWWDSYASIENVEIQIKPAGIYYETSIIFEVMATNADYDDETQLEYIYDFTLNKDAVFNDSWLWIEDYISKGELYEKSEGTQIYEDIVDRRQDPSILTKTGDRSYNFRIYPLFNNDVRKVKLSYLTIFDHSNDNLESEIPLSFIFDSYDLPQNVTLNIVDDNNWFHTPLNEGGWTMSYSEANLTTYTMNPSINYSHSTVSYDSDTQDEYKLGTYEGQDDNFFQISYKPDIQIEKKPSYNLILLDHESDNTNINITDVLTSISLRLDNFDSDDYFNILYQDFTPQFTGDTWQSCESDNIQNAIIELSGANTSTFSWLSSLLPSALAYIEDMGQNANIIIVSADNNFYELGSSDDFLSSINTYINNMTQEVSISAIDYSKNRPGDWINGSYQRGNEFLYNTLTANHNGSYEIVQTQSAMRNSLSKIATTDAILLEEFDLVLTNQDGFSYSKFISNASQKISIDEPILITGKYIGEPNFTLQFNAIYNDQLIHDNIPMEQNLELTSLAKDNWTSQYILANENSSDGTITNNVIETSIYNRLLSKKTIYLCLERDTSAISSNNGDGDDDIFIVSTTEIANPEIKVNAYPNPFAESIKINIPATLTTNTNDIRVEIFTTDGQLIKTLNQESDSENGNFTIQWTPESDLRGGIYFIRVISESGIQTLKVMYLN